MHIITAIAFVLLISSFGPQALAQSARANLEVDVLNRDGSAYIIHNQPIPLSHGYHVFRRTEGADWVQITDEPVVPVQNGFQLEQQMGTGFDMIQDFGESGNPQAIYLRLRGAGSRAMILMYALPEVARLMGHLFVDEDAPTGEQVAYRFKIVDDLERETGLNFETNALLEPYQSPAPQAFEVSNQDREVTLSWQYDEAEGKDHTIYFRPYYRKSDGTPVPEINDRFPLRQLDVNEYSYSFEVPEAGVEYAFWVEAVDFSGQASPESRRVEMRITENVPPEALNGVRGRANENYESELAWPVSTDLDVAGYHVYRGLNDQEEEQMERITNELLPPLQTSYVDTTTTPGTHYRYAVTVVDQSGNESEFSMSARVLIIDYTYPDPVASVNAEFNAEDGGINLEWQTSGENPNLKSYRILRRQLYPDIGRAYSQLNRGNYTSSSYSDTGVAGEGFVEGMTFEYGIAVVNRSGNVSDTVFTELQIPDLTPPDAPGSLSAEMRNNRRVALSWTSSPSLDVTHYQISRTDAANGESATLQTVNRGIRFFRDEELGLNRSFVYAVSAVDSVGNISEPARSDTLITSGVNPPLPAHNVMARADENGVSLRWQTRKSDASIRSFAIMRASIATGRYEEIGRTNADELNFTDPDGEAGLWYRVYPVDVTGRRAREARNTQAVRP